MMITFGGAANKS